MEKLNDVEYEQYDSDDNVEVDETKSDNTFNIEDEKEDSEEDFEDDEEDDNDDDNDDELLETKHEGRLKSLPTEEGV